MSKSNTSSMAHLPMPQNGTLPIVNAPFSISISITVSKKGSHKPLRKIFSILGFETEIQAENFLQRLMESLQSNLSAALQKRGILQYSLCITRQPWIMPAVYFTQTKMKRPTLALHTIIPYSNQFRTIANHMLQHFDFQ